MFDYDANPVPVGLIEAALNSQYVPELMDGSGTHDAALRLVGQLVQHSQEPTRIAEMIAACLPEGYQGNTLREVPRMVRDAVKRGFAEPRSIKTTSGEKMSSQALDDVRKLGIELFHTKQGRAFASVAPTGQGTTCLPIRSEAFKSAIRLAFFRARGKAISKEGLGETLDLLEARALYESPEEEVQVRLGRHGGNIYYDLGRSDGQVVEIRPDGWSLTSECPVRFYRPPGFAEQMVPEHGGDLEGLKRCLGLTGTNWVLVLAFLIASLNPAGPYLLLLVSGAHRSGKSFRCAAIKRIIDPNALEKLRLPKDEHSLVIMAVENWLLVFDNASSVRWEMSDSICALATGSGFSTRRFYTDDESRTFKNSRPVIINGIGEFADRPDLMDRSVPLRFDSLSSDMMKTERQLNADLDQALPGVLGRLFDIASHALAHLDSVEAPTTIRMTDAGQWLVAAEPAAGLPPGTFVKALEAGLVEMMVTKAVNDPLVIALLKFLQARRPRPEYVGGFGDLHQRLTSESFRYDDRLPPTPAHLSNAVQRLAPAMASIGLMVEFPPRSSKGQRVRIWLGDSDQRPDVEEKQHKF